MSSVEIMSIRQKKLTNKFIYSKYIILFIKILFGIDMVIKVKKRNFLKKKKIKEIKSELGEYGNLLQGKKNVEILEAEPNSFILVDGEPYIIIIDDKAFPTLKAALSFSRIRFSNGIFDVRVGEWVVINVWLFSLGSAVFKKLYKFTCNCG